MIKIKLVIDPSKIKEVAALAQLMQVIGERKQIDGSAETFLKHVASDEAEQKLPPLQAPILPPVTKQRPVTKEVPKQEETPTEELDIFANKEQAPTEQASPEETPAEETQLQEVEKESSDVASLENIREMLGQKVTNNREKIKAKLTELGAKNVSQLDTKHYNTVYNFLASL